jgi:hypothetical protein
MNIILFNEYFCSITNHVFSTRQSEVNFQNLRRPMRQLKARKRTGRVFFSSNILQIFLHKMAACLEYAQNSVVVLNI